MGRGTTGDMCGRKGIEGRSWELGIGFAADTDDPEPPKGSPDSNGKPEACCALGVSRFGIVPVPARTFGLFEATFNPGTHGIPKDVSLFRV